jgi:hypothetical protein
MTLNITTEADFMTLKPNNISSVYSGIRDSCRCGCGGDYISSSFDKNPNNVINDSLVDKRLKRAKKLVSSGANVDYGGTYIDVQTGKNRTLTFYVDDLKD